MPRKLIGVGVVAVRIIGDVTRRSGAILDRIGRVAIPVAVRIGVEGGLHPFVDLPVAVVVDAVADLRCCRVDRRVCVVAIQVGRVHQFIGRLEARGSGTGCRDYTGCIPVVILVFIPGLEGMDRRVVVVAVDRVEVGELGGQFITFRPFTARHGYISAVAVIVHIVVPALIRKLIGVGVVAVRIVGDVTRRSGAILDCIGRVAVTVAVRIGVEGGLHPFVDLSVAVVVDAVADLCCCRVDRRVCVVAIQVGGIHQFSGGFKACGPGAGSRKGTACITVVVLILVPDLAHEYRRVVVIAVNGIEIGEFGGQLITFRPFAACYPYISTVAVIVKIAVPALVRELVRVSVVAVVVVGDVACRWGAILDGNIRITESVAVGIGVEGGLQALVDLAVAVVVLSIADFYVAGEIIGIVVITVTVLQADAVSISIFTIGDHLRLGITAGLVTEDRNGTTYCPGSVYEVVDTAAVGQYAIAIDIQIASYGCNIGQTIQVGQMAIGYYYQVFRYGCDVGKAVQIDNG